MFIALNLTFIIYHCLYVHGQELHFFWDFILGKIPNLIATPRAYLNIWIHFWWKQGGQKFSRDRCADMPASYMQSNWLNQAAQAQKSSLNLLIPSSITFLLFTNRWLIRSATLSEKERKYFFLSLLIHLHYQLYCLLPLALINCSLITNQSIKIVFISICKDN